MSAIKRVSDLGTRGVVNIADGIVVASDIATNSITQTKLSTDVPLSGFRNVIINGGFDIWQRSTNFTTAGGGYGGADRWYAGFATGSFSRVAFDLGNTISGYESQYFGRWTLSSNSQNYEFLQKIEGVRTLAGQTATISFWAKREPGTTTVNLRLVQNFGTGGSPSSLVVTSVGSPSLTTSWQRFVYTVNIPSISGKTIGTNSDDCLWLSFQVSNTATGTIDFWGVQVEKGSQVTPFEQRPIGTELALCQRYFRRTTPTAYGEGTVFGYGVAGNSVGYVYALPVQMRTTPTVSKLGTWASSNVTTSTPFIAPQGPSSVFAYVNATASGVVYIYSNESAYLTFDAEIP